MKYVHIRYPYRILNNRTRYDRNSRRRFRMGTMLFGRVRFSRSANFDFFTDGRTSSKDKVWFNTIMIVSITWFTVYGTHIEYNTRECYYLGRHIIILFRGNSRGYYYSGGYDFQTSREIPQGTITGEGTIIRNARVCMYT